MEKNPVIQVKNLVVRYGDKVILDHINFNVFKGEIVAVLGASGCGKTTFLRHIVGLGKPFSGNVFIDGDEITSDNEDTFRSAIRKIGILFQGGALFGSMTLAENVALPITEYSGLPKNAVAHLVRMKLDLVNLAGFENHLPSEISGGMKKRAALARALALNPKILFLDEPSAGLDPIISAEIDELILSINQRIGTTIVMVTHELESIFRVARRAVMLDGNIKNIIADGAPEFLKNHSPNPFVKQFFNREARIV
ncbi:MAG TPA: ATP-binding cassette domain-containing protein [Desulfobacterales bacterium]|nr:ATP-binding cassette domain-containing protein [Desulfobacterales bacterium]